VVSLFPDAFRQIGTVYGADVVYAFLLEGYVRWFPVPLPCSLFLVRSRFLGRMFILP
jgi:hypothetical protein